MLINSCYFTVLCNYNYGREEPEEPRHLALVHSKESMCQTRHQIGSSLDEITKH